MDAAWVTFQHLQDLCSIANSSSLFPPPISTENVISATSSPSVYFNFETPHLPSLVKYSSITGMSLAANLRKYPLILRRWCSQLGAAYHDLKNLSHINISPPTIDDVFIGEVLPSCTLFTLIIGWIDTFGEPPNLYWRIAANSFTKAP